MVDSPNARPERLPSLDGLRAVSVLIVIWSHQSVFQFSLGGLIPDGGFGVRVFFVISGYIITRLLLLEESRRGRVRLGMFYCRRALRIMPALVVYLATLLVLSRAGYITLLWRRDLLPSLTFTSALRFWHQDVIWETRHLWTLSVEEQFYLVWPVMFVLLHRRLRTAFAVAVVSAGPAVRYWLYFHSTKRLGYTIVAHGDMIAMGCVLAILEFERPAVIQRVTNWRPSIGRGLAVAAMGLSPMYFYRAFSRNLPGLSGNELVMTAHAGGIAYLIASFVHVRRGIAYRLLNLRAVMAIGIVSYGLYLWQQLFIRGDHWFQQFPLNLLLLAGVTATSFFCVERPFRGWGRSPSGSAPVTTG